MLCIRMIVLAAIIVAMVSARTAAPNDPVVAAAQKLEAAFSNLTFMTESPGLGSLFTEDGTWCSQKGTPCVTGASNITAYVLGFKTNLGLVDALARFTFVSSTNVVGSFDYTKTFTCTSPCGPRTCLVPGKSGFTVDLSSGKVIELDDYVSTDDFSNYCIDRCTHC